MIDIIWTEKYRPKTLSEYYMNKMQMEKVKDWINNLRKIEKSDNEDDDNSIPKPFLILYGSAGVGKTTLAYLILEKFGYDIIECNASDTRSKKQIREMLGGISSVSVCVDGKNNFKKTAIIMDEIDGINTITESSGIQELLDIIINNKTVKNKINISAGNISAGNISAGNISGNIKWVCPVICTTNSIKDKKIQLLAKYGIVLHIDKPSNNDMLKLISRISLTEGFEINASSKSDIITRANGDYRQIILLLYDYYKDLQFKTSKNIKYLSNLSNVLELEKECEEDKNREEDRLKQAIIRDINNTGETPLDKINYFLTHKTDMEIIRYFCSGDSNLYFMNFYHNVINVLQTIQDKLKEPKNKDNFLKNYKQLIKIYDSLKNADILNDPIFLNKNWELLDYFDIFSVGNPSQLIYNSLIRTNENNISNDNKLVKEFNLTHHSPYNFMRQEQSINRKLTNADYFQVFDMDIVNMYYNLKRFQNANNELIKKYSKMKKKAVSNEDAKYVIDKSYCKIIDKIDELLN